MPIRLKPPRPGRSPFWSGRGTHMGVSVDRSTRCVDKEKARRVIRSWEAKIESGAFATPGEPTFMTAAIVYGEAGGDRRFLGSLDRATGQWNGLIGHFGDLKLTAIDQAAIDAAATALYPTATAATRNRQVHTVVSAVLKHAGIDARIRRPKGWRGVQRTGWMRPESAFRLLKAGEAVDAEFGTFLTVTLYTGLRLSEALRMTVNDLDLGNAYALVRRTKNSEPRGVHLPPAAVAALASHPRGLDRPGQRVFRFSKNGRLYIWLARAKKAAGPDLDGVTFHSLRHTWGAWMRRYGGLDTSGLVATGAWKDRASAARYEHAVASEEAQRADLLPVKGRA